MSGAARGGVAAAVAAPLVLFGLVAGFVVVLGGEDDASLCNPGSSTAVSIDPASIPGVPIAGYSGDQLLNAAYIMEAAAALGLSSRDQTIGVMTAMGESSLQVLDRGDAVGPDSRGLFQQRDSWGPYEVRMDPYQSATLFFERLQGVEGRDSLAPTIVAHRVQVNADPYHYERYWDAAVLVVEGLTGIDLDLSPTGGGQSCSSVGLTPGEVNTEGWADVSPGPVTSGFGWRRDPVTGSFSKLHAGTDMAAGCGAPIWSANDGVVVRAGMGYDPLGAGLVEIDHGGGLVTRYYHMEASGIFVSEGDTVTGGQQIAAEGSSGWSTGCHLHYEMLVDGEHVDPEQLMSDNGITL